MTVKLMVFLKRKQGLSPEEFRDRYENGHSRIGMRMLGHLWKEYRRNYLLPADSFAKAEGAPLSADEAETEAPYDVVTEFVFADRADLEEQNRIATLPENKKILSEDEETLFDREQCYAMLCEVLEEDLDAARAAGMLAGAR